MHNFVFYVPNHVPASDNRETSALRSERPILPELIGRVHDQNSYFIDKIASRCRVLIVEGISGSGKDTFQAYLKKKLQNRDVYDYSEGEVLTSWKQLQIEGIFELRIKFMKLFINYVRDVVSRETNSVFLLNRFHLSAYAQQPQVGAEYSEIISVLRTLPVHIFILQVDPNDIEQRSLHPERSGAWRRFQQQIGASFRERLEKQQSAILELARRQGLPYSVIRLTCEPGIRDGQVAMFEATTVTHHGVPMNPASGKVSRKKRSIRQPVKETA